jgi:argininosuccinate synthase
MIVPPEKAPDTPGYVNISYDKGNPVAIDNKRMSPSRLLDRLNTIAGGHGIGRVDTVENRYVGIKSRGVYETPGGTVLHSAHRALESIVLDREIMHLRDSLITRYAELVYYGYWFSPERVALQNLIDDMQKDVAGTVRMKLYKGSCFTVGRKSPYSLYNPELATFEKEDVYNQKDAEGFIRINALRLKLSKLRKKGKR